MILEKFSRNRREENVEVAEAIIAQEDTQREVLIEDTLREVSSSRKTDLEQRNAIVQSIKYSYRNQPLSALKNFLYELSADSYEAGKIQKTLRLIAQRHGVLDVLSQSMGDDGVSKELGDTSFLRHNYAYDSEALMAMVKSYGWRYVPLMMKSDWRPKDNTFMLIEEGSQEDVAVDFDGIHACIVTTMLQYNRNHSTFQNITRRVRTISLYDDYKIAMVDMRKGAVRLGGGLAGAYTQSQEVAVNWREFFIDTCSQMEKTLRIILGHGKLDAGRHGRGFLVTQGSVPLGIIKAFGEPSFIAARTVYDDDGKVLLLRGMVYAIGIGKLDSRRDAYIIESNLGKRLKRNVHVAKKKNALMRSFLPSNNGVVPQRSVDLEVLKNYMAPQNRALFFKAMRMTKSSDIYKSLHTMFVRAEQSPSHHISEEDVRRACWTIATNE